MKKKLLISLLIAALVVCSLTVGILATDSAAEGTEGITFRIAAATLTLSESVRINFKVEVPESADVSTLNLLVWEGVPTDEAGNVSYTKDATYTDFVTEDGKKVQDTNAANTDVYLTEKKNAVTLSVLKTEAADTTSTGNARYVFQYSGIASAEFGKTVYACAYYEAGGETVYTKPIRYSVAEYIYNKQKAEAEKEEADKVAGFEALLDSLVAYGNASSVYFAGEGEPTGPSIPTVVIENDGVSTTTNTVDMHTVTLTDGTFADGFTTGKFLAGETVSFSVPEGCTFYGWKKGETFTEITESSITVIEDATYTPVYGTTGLTIDENGTVTGYDDKATEVVIPANVTSIGAQAFEYCTLTSVTIPASVTSIGEYAFSNCWNLTSVTIHEGVESIGDFAFNGCGSLTSVTIPASVKSIGDSAFGDCTSLTSITVAEGHTEYKSVDGVLYSYDGKTLICYLAGKSDTTFAIPNSVTSIGNYAFSYCSNLTSITIPDSVTSIGNNAFAECDALTSIEIPASVKSIGEGVFNCCDVLTSVTISANVTSIGNGAFAECRALTSVTIPDSVTSIGDYAFRNCTALTSVTIPDGVTSIGVQAFYGCSSLTTVYYNGTVTGNTVANYNFGTSIKISGFTFEANTDNTAYTVTGYTVNGEKDPTSVSLTIPATYKDIPVTAIGAQAFQYCTELTSIEIPDSVTSIGASAFEYCTSLTSVTIHEGVESIGASAFIGCGLTSVTIPKSVTSIGEGAFAECTALTSVTIHEGVTSIGNYAFFYCSNLTSVTIHEGVTSIGDSAFSECAALTSIEIPESVKSIGASAFSGCKALTSVTIHEGVESIGDNAFHGCTSLTSVTIPASVTSIGTQAFYGCTSLTSVTIPESVTSIGNGAFAECTALTTINYAGTEAEWATLSANASVPTGVTVICSDATITTE